MNPNTVSGPMRNSSLYQPSIFSSSTSAIWPHSSNVSASKITSKQVFEINTSKIRSDVYKTNSASITVLPYNWTIPISRDHFSNMNIGDRAAIGPNAERIPRATSRTRTGGRRVNLQCVDVNS